MVGEKVCLAWNMMGRPESPCQGWWDMAVVWANVSEETALGTSILWGLVKLWIPSWLQIFTAAFLVWQAFFTFPHSADCGCCAILNPHGSMFLGPSATGPNPDDTVRACPQHPPLLQTVPGTSGESVPQLNSYLANPDILPIGEKCTTAFPGAKPRCSHYLENAWNLKKKTPPKQMSDQLVHRLLLFWRLRRKKWSVPT